MKLACSLLSCICLIAIQGPAFSATTISSSVGISATVTASCSISNVSDLEFGDDLSIGDLPRDVITTFNVTCTKTTPYSIGLDKGVTPGASTTDRKLGGGESTLSYALYRDATRLTNWGDDSNSWMTNLAGTGAEVTHFIYGRIPDQTWPAPDVYSDIVKITVEY